MALFDLPPRTTKSADLAVIQKAKSKSKKTPTVVKGGGGIVTLISNIKDKVLNALGKYARDTLCIRDRDELHDYITAAIEFGEVAIDTETTGLDPMLDECVGISLYVPGQKTCYVPINHISYITMARIDNQLSSQEVAEELRRLAITDTKIIMFNAPFDLRVIKNRLGVRLHCYWDCSIGSRLLNENEKYEMTGKVGLKKLHQKYVLKGQEDAFAFDDLFDPKKIKFDVVPINVGYLYAAHDAIITYQYYDFQKLFLYYEPDCTIEERDGLNGVSYTFFNIEMPIVDVVVDMEDIGVSLDVLYARELSVKYHELEEKALANYYQVLEQYGNQIEAYRTTHPGCKLDDPVKISSPQQLAILFYDILGCVSNDKRKPRGTGNKILKSFKMPLADAILEYRGVMKLLTTYIDKLPECLNPNDHRLHCKFNQYGADTGRFSSSDPNLQNIPSHNKDIRPMFVATNGYVLMSSDFSQQEPKCLAALCRRDGDSQMFETFMQGKDLYSEIASKAFNVPYFECLEFDPLTGEKNPPEYKERRTQAKSILLGVLYGRGIASIAEQLGCTEQEAQQIKDSVFRGFPAIEDFEIRSLQMAKEVGYVTTVCGRKRRLPDLQLPEYSITWENGFEPEGDLLDFDLVEIEVPHSKQVYYLNRLANARGYKSRNSIIEQAKREHLVITDNSRRIADATRQCVNARIQGSAADLTKLAMIELYANKRLKELGFRMLIPVHDEIIAECPKENAKECSKLLADVMSHAAEEILDMPIKCDVEITEAWYGEKIQWYQDEEDDDDEE